jgi:hypothetical protein
MIYTTKIRELLDSYTRAYVVAQARVISEVSGDISRMRLEMLDKVNRDREAVALEPFEVPDDWVVNEEVG